MITFQPHNSFESLSLRFRTAYAWIVEVKQQIIDRQFHSDHVKFPEHHF